MYLHIHNINFTKNNMHVNITFISRYNVARNDSAVSKSTRCYLVVTKGRCIQYVVIILAI